MNLLKYDEYISCDDESILSIDKVRIVFQLRKSGYNSFQDIINESLREKVTCRFRTCDIFSGSRYVGELCFDNAKCFMGFHLVPKFGIENPNMGFIEFNPNKIASSADFQVFYQCLKTSSKQIRVKRFDLAQDFPFQRSSVWLRKDRKQYCWMMKDYGAVTETQGRRNKPGYSRVYDKSYKEKLDQPLTRVELTCSGEWSYEQIRKAAPNVYFAPDVSLGRAKMHLADALALSLGKQMQAGYPIQDVVTYLPFRTKKRVYEQIGNRRLNLFPACETMNLLESLRRWEAD